MKRVASFVAVLLAVLLVLPATHVFAHGSHPHALEELGAHLDATYAQGLIADVEITQNRQGVMTQTA